MIVILRVGSKHVNEAYIYMEYTFSQAGFCGCAVSRGHQEGFSFCKTSSTRFSNTRTVIGWSLFDSFCNNNEKDDNFLILPCVASIVNNGAIMFRVPKKYRWKVCISRNTSVDPCKDRLSVRFILITTYYFALQ